MSAHAPKMGPSTESSTSFQVVHRSGSGLGEAQQTPWPALAGLVHTRRRRGYFRYVLWQAMELIERLAARELVVSVAQLERWRRAGLLPPHPRRWPGRGQGSVSVLEERTVEVAAALAQHATCAGRSWPGTPRPVCRSCQGVQRFPSHRGRPYGRRCCGRRGEARCSACSTRRARPVRTPLKTMAQGHHGGDAPEDRPA